MTIERREFFGRQVILEAGGYVWNELDVEFEVELTVEHEPNSALLTIWGLTRESAIIFDDPFTEIKLFAGYETTHLLFQGNPIHSQVYFEKADRRLEIECSDEGFLKQRERLSYSYRTSRSAKDLLHETIGDMGLPTGYIDDSNVTIVWENGINFTGSPNALLTRIARRSNSDWSIQDGAIQFLPKDKAKPGGGDFLFSSQIGNLIDSPVFDEEGVKIKALLTPAIRPGDKFQVEYLSGDNSFDTTDYKATTVIFKGSLYGNQFYTEIDGVEL